MNKEERNQYAKLFKKVIIANIREARLNKGWTQEQLAEAISVSNSYYRRMESEKGKDHFSTFSIWLVAKALDVDLNELLDFDMDAFRTTIEKAIQESNHS